MKLQLTLSIEYNDSSIQSMKPDELERMLQDIANHAASNGLFTGETPAEVESWQAKVVKIHEQKEKLFNVCIDHHYICKKNQIDQVKECYFEDIGQAWLSSELRNWIKVVDAPDATEADIPEFIDEMEE